MAITYRKGLRLGPVHLNFSGSGVGYSVGALGVRLGHSSRGRKYASADLPGGFRFFQSLKPLAKREPFGGGMVDIGHGNEFWFDVEGEHEHQQEISDAVGEVERMGGTEPIVPVFLTRLDDSTMGVSVNARSTFHQVGTVRPITDGLASLAARLGDGEASVGTCKALVFYDEGAFGLKLNLDRRHVETPKASVLPIALIAGVLAAPMLFAKALFGRKRRR